MCCKFVQYELLGMLGGIKKKTTTPSCSLLPFVTVLTIYSIRHNDDHEHYHYGLQAVRNIPIWHTLLLVLFLLSSAASYLWLRPWAVMSGYGGPCASEEGSLQAHHILCLVLDRADDDRRHTTYSEWHQFLPVLSSTPTQIIASNESTALV